MRSQRSNTTMPHDPVQHSLMERVQFLCRGLGENRDVEIIVRNQRWPRASIVDDNVHVVTASVDDEAVFEIANLCHRQIIALHSLY